MPRVVYLLAFSFGLSLLAAGCGSNSDAEDEPVSKKAKKKSETKIATLAGKLGTFDEGRIEVPLPKGWKDSVNEEAEDNDPNKNLARMSGEGIQRIPGILVKVREYGDFKTLGPPDLRKFVRKRAAEIPAERNAKGKFDVKPLTLDGFNGAEYAYKLKVGGKPYERLTLETVVDGRLYTLELTTLNQLREESRPQLYAVAAGLKFPKMVNKPTRGRASASEDEEAGDDGETSSDEDKAKDEEKSDESADSEKEADSE